ncbi:MAG: hypothetical protein ACYDC1_25465, partial [Limisphaerales bacterium]
RQRRLVNLEPTTRAWLKVARKLNADLPLPLTSRRRYQRELREVFGWRHWPKDVLRHSCASYLLALKRDAQAVALELGNSPAILFKHYRELVTQEQARRFWNLIPRSERHAQPTIH